MKRPVLLHGHWICHRLVFHQFGFSPFDLSLSRRSRLFTIALEVEQPLLSLFRWATRWVAILQGNTSSPARHTCLEGTVPYGSNGIPYRATLQHHSHVDVGSGWPLRTSLRLKLSLLFIVVHTSGWNEPPESGSCQTTIPRQQSLCCVFLSLGVCTVCTVCSPPAAL